MNIFLEERWQREAELSVREARQQREEKILAERE